MKAKVLILPGLYNSGPGHWQTLWATAHPEFLRVEQADWDRPRCADWVATLDAAVRETGDNVVLVGHSTACALVAIWAGQAGRRIRGALLVAPSDTEAPGYPAGPEGFTPMPMNRLPFRSIVITSADDPYVSLERATDFAAAWGSELVNIGLAGHINGSSGLGDWPTGLAMLENLRAKSTEMGK